MEIINRVAELTGWSLDTVLLCAFGIVALVFGIIGGLLKAPTPQPQPQPLPPVDPKPELPPKNRMQILADRVPYLQELITLILGQDRELGRANNPREALTPIRDQLNALFNLRTIDGFANRDSVVDEAAARHATLLIREWIGVVRPLAVILANCERVSLTTQSESIGLIAHLDALKSGLEWTHDELKNWQGADYRVVVNPNTAADATATTGSESVADSTAAGGTTGDTAGV